MLLLLHINKKIQYIYSYIIIKFVCTHISGVHFARISLNGQCHNIFVCWFFHQIAPPGPIRGTFGRFRFFPKIRRDIRQKVGSGVYDTPRNGDWAVYLTPWSLCQQFFALFCYFFTLLKLILNSESLFLHQLIGVSYTGE